MTLSEALAAADGTARVQPGVKEIALLLLAAEVRRLRDEVRALRTHDRSDLL